MSFYVEIFRRVRYCLILNSKFKIYN